MNDKPKRFVGRGEAAVAIAHALGVDPNTCVGIEFRMFATEVVTVTVHRHVYDHEAKALATVLERFNLVPESAPDEAPELSASDRKVQKIVKGGE